MSAQIKNLHDLFFRSSGNSLHSNILLTMREDTALTAARDTIRTRIRRDLQTVLQQLSGDVALRVRPKFFMQGSKSYETLIAPLWPPRQQADLDDGIYVPLSYAENYGPPKLVSDHYTGAIEIILGHLAKEQGWQLDTSNPNCTRVILIDGNNTPTKHVDISAYCMPDKEFISLVEARVALNKAQGFRFSEEEVSDDDWDFYPKEHVLHAHKEKGWQPSDPRPFRDWFLRQVALKTEQLRRVIRYLKAWRDAQIWNVTDPKSILLMVAIDAAFTRAIANRDDLALQQVLHALPNVLQENLINPTDPLNKEDLTQRLDDDGIRTEVIRKVSSLAQALDRALSGTLTDPQIHDLLRSHWGSRFPTYTSPRPVSVVRATPAAPIVAAPTIGTRKSG